MTADMHGGIDVNIDFGELLNPVAAVDIDIEFEIALMVRGALRKIGEGGKFAFDYVGKAVDNGREIVLTCDVDDSEVAVNEDVLVYTLIVCVDVKMVQPVTFLRRLHHEIVHIHCALQVMETGSLNIGADVKIHHMPLIFAGQTECFRIEMTGIGLDGGRGGGSGEVDFSFQTNLSVGVINAQRAVEGFLVVETIDSDVVVGVAVEVKMTDLTFGIERHLFVERQLSVHINGGGDKS